MHRDVIRVRLSTPERGSRNRRRNSVPVTGAHTGHGVERRARAQETRGGGCGCDVAKCELLYLKEKSENQIREFTIFLFLGSYAAKS